MRRQVPHPPFALLLAGALALGGCGADEASPMEGSATPTPAAEVPITVTHILIGMKGDKRMKTERSPEQALQIANSVLLELQGGRPMEELIEKFTDDRNKDGKPNTNNGKPGSYDFTSKAQLASEFEAAMKALLPGKTTPQPVKTIFGYHIIRRDK